MSKALKSWKRWVKDSHPLPPPLQPQLAVSMSYIQLSINSLPLFPSVRCAKEPPLQCCERTHLSGGWGGVCAQLAHLVFDNEPGDSLGSCCCRSVRLDKSSSCSVESIISLLFVELPLVADACLNSCEVLCITKYFEKHSPCHCCHGNDDTDDSPKGWLKRVEQRG